jgi:hypothetical protein
MHASYCQSSSKEVEKGQRGEEEGRAFHYKNKVLKLFY